MDELDEIAGLGARYDLNTAAVEQLRVLLRLLVDDPLSPTSIREDRRAIDDHLADSLVALELEALGAVHRVADLGSGAGLPGLPLAIARPAAEFALVESASRKTSFIERAIAECRVSNACAITARAEAWPAGIGRFDVVTARAVARLAVVAEYAAPLLRLGGVAVFWRGRRDSDDEAAGAAAARELGLEPGGVLRVRPYPTAEHRCLHLMSKVTETPDRFPRRPGIAAKRPLGARRDRAPGAGVAGSDRARR